MNGNEKLGHLGFKEEARGEMRLHLVFKSQRQWTDFKTNGDFMEAISNSSFDWDGYRMPRIVATENDSMNGVSMLLDIFLLILPKCLQMLELTGAQKLCEAIYKSRTRWTLQRRNHTFD